MKCEASQRCYIIRKRDHRVVLVLLLSGNVYLLLPFLWSSPSTGLSFGRICKSHVDFLDGPGFRFVAVFRRFRLTTHLVSDSLVDFSGSVFIVPYLVVHGFQH